jgi:C4-dicarboxylate-binding protein DctP
VRVEVYPNSELFADEIVLQKMVFGLRSAEFVAPSISKFRSITDRLQVFDLPVLFDDVDAVHRFQAGPTGRMLLESLSAAGIKALAYWDNGMRVISATRPLRAPADVQGLRFRIEPSPVIQAQYKALNAVTFELPFDRVYDSMASGLIEGGENSWSNIYASRFYEVHKYITETNHSFLGYIVATSTRFWDSLPDEVRQELERILAEVTEEVNRIAKEHAANSRQKVIDQGVKVIELTAGEREAWVTTLKPIWQQFEAEIGKKEIDAAASTNRD